MTKRMPFDRYTLMARVNPALLSILPIGIVVFAWLTEQSTALAGVIGAASTCGGTALLAQLGRDRGRKQQPQLWASWGGAPTTRGLRFKDATNRSIVQHLHSQLELVTGRTLPTEDEESTQPDRADEIYEAAVSVLRERTRERSKFPLVFDANVSYGFRRNLWGLKPYGLALSLLGAALCWGLFLVTAGLPPSDIWLEILVREPDATAAARLAGSVLNTVAIAIWLFTVNPAWVKVTADAYAERLLYSTESLAIASEER